MSNVRYLATKNPAVLELMKIEAYERRQQAEKRRQYRRYGLIITAVVLAAGAAMIVPMFFSEWLLSILA